MKKFIFITLSVIITSVFVFAALGALKEKKPKENTQDILPEHKFIDLPDKGRLVAIECGQPCAVIFSDKENSYVALLLDGNTITFKLP